MDTVGMMGQYRSRKPKTDKTWYNYESFVIGDLKLQAREKSSMMGIQRIHFIEWVDEANNIYGREVISKRRS